ncbi:MAG: PAS domain S-box protein [Anaerolineales bacterium]
MRESEKRFQDLIEQASDGIFVADTTGRYTLVNEEGCRLVGYTKDEILSMNMRDLIAPEELENDPIRIDELRSGKTVRSQRNLLRKDKSRIICEISGKMLPDGSFQSIVRDITERKITEDALIRSEKRYHSLFENMVNGYARCQMLYDEQGRPNDFIFLDVNNAFKKIIGLKDVLGRRVSELIPNIQTSNPEVIELYGRVAATGHSEQFETYVPGLGSGMWFSVSAYSFEKGFFVALFESINERKHTEEILQQSYKQLLSFIEQAPLSVAMFDREMNYLAVSHRWIHHYGRGHTNLVGLNHYDVNPDVSDTWKEAHQKGLSGKVLKNDDDLWVQNDGTKNWLKWTIAPWKDEHGKIGGIIISAEDISERKRAEANAFKSELRYHRVLDAMMEGCQIIDFDWKYVYVNDVVAKQGKHTPQELLNRHHDGDIPWH